MCSGSLPLERPVLADGVGERHVVVRVRELAVVADPFQISSASAYATCIRGMSPCHQQMPPSASSSRARSRGSSCDQGAASIASSRRRASARWPCFCQNRHIANARGIATVGSGSRDRAVEHRPDVVVGELEAVEPRSAGRRRTAPARPSRPGGRTSRDAGRRWRRARRGRPAAPRRTRGWTRAVRSAARRRASRRSGPGSGRRAPTGRRRRRRRAPTPVRARPRPPRCRPARRTPTAGRAAAGCPSSSRS